MRPLATSLLHLAISLLVSSISLGQEVSAPLAQTANEAASDDEVLAERLATIYETLTGFDSVSVTVANGVVELSGETANAEMRARAVAIAEGLPETVYVVDDLSQETNLRRTLAPAWDKMRGYLTDAVALLPLIGVALLIVMVFWLLARWVSNWSFFYQRLGLNPLLQSFVRQAVRLLVFLLGLLLALDILGATPFVTAILGTAGIAGVALGFAFRDIVENYLAGILMSVRQPFKRGDFVQVGDKQGKIIRMTNRELVLMTAEGNHLRIPNATVFTSELVNYSRNPRRRFDFLVGVDVGEDLKQVQTLGINTLLATNGVLSDPPPGAFIKELGDFNVVVQFMAWINQDEAEFLKVKSQAIRVLKESFDAAGVLMPEPISNVRVQQVPKDAAITDEGFANSSPPKPSKSTTPPPQIVHDAEDADVELETHLDQQIAESEAAADEPDLLSESSPNVH